MIDKKMSKRKSGFMEYDTDTLYDLIEAIKIVKSCANAKFTESFDVSFRLGIDPKKSDQMIRGATVLPYGTGKIVRIAVFAEGAIADAALDAGADIVGLDSLVADIKAGKIEFDISVATPSVMSTVGSLGQILGPRGLMPNPKNGTITDDVVKAINNIRSGQVNYRNDKTGIIHASIGRVSFSDADLIANLRSFYDALILAKPSTSKGQYIRSISVSSTMGVGVKLKLSSI